MMDIETLLREADPAGRPSDPSAISDVSAQIHGVVMARAGTPDPTTSRRRTVKRVGLPAAGALVLAAVVVLVLALLTGPVGPLTSKASAALNRLAAQAAAAPPVTSLAPGQYFYTETESPTYEIGSGSSPPTPANPDYDEYLNGTVQTWVAADGSGRRVTTTDPTPRFFTPADEHTWQESGRPPAAVPPNELTEVDQYGPGTAGEVNGPLPLYDVAGLPTDPAALSAVLGNENADRTSLGTLPAGIKTLDFVSQCITSSCSLFERAVGLLQGPDIGGTSALRQALFEVLASVPGVQLLGLTTDHAGQSGLGLQLVDTEPAGTTTVNCAKSDATEQVVSGHRLTYRITPGHLTTTNTLTYHHPAHSNIFTIVVDPQTTTLLSSEESFSPSVFTAPPNPCVPSLATPQTAVLTPTWKIILGSGVVDSDTALPIPSSP
jgi:hypothetical protein